MNEMESSSKILHLPKVFDVRGSLTYVENAREIPFEVKRVFYLYDVPAGSSRAGHALKTCKQFLIAVSGSFDVVVEEKGIRQIFTLSKPYEGLFLPALVWREIHNFSAGAVCFVLASEYYEESNYCREITQFRNFSG